MIRQDIIERKHIVRPGADACHYRDYLISAAHLLQYVTDCVACLSSVREGTGGLIANINGNFREEVHAMDELIITVRYESAGNTSRKYSFKIEKTIAYNTEGARIATLLDTPSICVDGICTLVVKQH